MKLAALFSGGKDSTYSILRAQQMGHVVSCLITIIPHSAESHLLHHPNISHTKIQAESMGIPQMVARAESETIDELDLLRSVLKEAKTRFDIRGVVHGGILSEFQRSRFESAAEDAGLEVMAPLWKQDQKKYMSDLLGAGFEFVISSVSCQGLDESWLGRKVARADLAELERLSAKHGFNLSFEGGEAETFVVDCPLFEWPIKITKTQSSWDGYRGTIEILQTEKEHQC